jgi:hypothetical protein
MNNAQLLVELMLQFALKQQEIAVMFRNANGGDITDEQVANSAIARDVALMKAEARVGTQPTG